MITKLSGEGLWFTSDTHFNHANILKFTNRPFENVTEHDEALIKNWNGRVGVNDTVFHLGDFCFGDDEEWNYVIDRLKGKIVLVIGNHDMRNRRKDFMNRFAMVTPQLKIKIEKQKIYLNHFPFLCFSGEDHGTWQLFGHIHTNPYNHNVMDELRKGILQPTQYDVGVDNNDFTPVSYRKIQEIISNKLTHQR